MTDNTNETTGTVRTANVQVRMDIEVWRRMMKDIIDRKHEGETLTNWITDAVRRKLEGVKEQ